MKFDEEPHYSEYRELFRNLFISSGFTYDYKYDWVGHENDKVQPKQAIQSTENMKAKPRILPAVHHRYSSGNYNMAHSFHQFRPTKKERPLSTFQRNINPFLTFF